MSDTEIKKHRHHSRKTITPMETIELIELVRQRPCVWDRHSEEYRNRQLRDIAWIEICRALEPTYDIMSRTEQQEYLAMINRRWGNIRDCYKKSLSGIRYSASGRPYMYADQLTFLDVVLSTKVISKNKKRVFHVDQEEPQQEEWLNEVFVDMENSEAEPQPEPTKKVKLEYVRPKETNEPDENIVSVLVKLIEKEDDEDRAFFKSITPAVKSLNDDDKFVFRIKVMKLLKLLKKNRDQKTIQSIMEDSETD